MKMFRMGLEGGKPPAGRVGRPAGVVLQGQRHDDRRARRAAGLAALRHGRRRGAGDRRHLRHRRRRHALPRRLRAVQRVLRPRHRAGQLPLPRAFQAAATRPTARKSWSATLPADVRGTSRIRRGGEDALGKAVPVGRGEHVAHHRQSRAPPLQVRRCSASRATCMSTCSARRRSPSPTASGPEPGDVFEIEAPDFGLPLRNPLKVAEDGYDRNAARVEVL